MARMDIGAAIRQQMLSVLIDAIGRPAGASSSAPAPGVSPPGPVASTGTPAGGLATGAAMPLPPLRPGAEIFARVVAVTPEGDATIAIGDRLALARIAGHALPDAARQPGATLLLKVEATGETPRFTLLQVAPAPHAPVPNAPAPNSPAPAAPQRPGPDAATPGLTQRTLVPTVANGAPEAMRTAPAAILDVPDPARAEALRPRAETPALPAIMQAAAAAAAPRQASAALLFAELAPLLGRADAPLPPAAAATARMLLDSRLDGEKPIAPEALKQALQRAAVPAEALVARGDPAIADVKTMIVALRGLLALAERHPPAQAPAPDAEPPHKDGGPAAIRPASPRLDLDAEPQAVVATLAREADQAVERTRLHQIASLPDPRPLEPARQHMSFDLPLALGQQTAIAGFRIDREKRGGKNAAGGAIDSWGVRFAIDADGLGPVQAHLRLTGNAVSVSLWAEDPATRQHFLDSLPTLEAALAESALDIGELAVLAGRPVEPKPQAGLFLDRSS
jgi:hypothetical protein